MFSNNSQIYENNFSEGCSKCDAELDIDIKRYVGTKTAIVSKLLKSKGIHCTLCRDMCVCKDWCLYHCN